MWSYLLQTLHASTAFYFWVVRLEERLQHEAAVARWCNPLFSHVFSSHGEFSWWAVVQFLGERLCQTVKKLLNQFLVTFCYKPSSSGIDWSAIQSWQELNAPEKMLFSTQSGELYPNMCDSPHQDMEDKCRHRILDCKEFLCLLVFLFFLPPTHITSGVT